MFNLSFTKNDVVRSLWVLAIGFATALATTKDTSKAGLIAAGAAALIALKNFVLADGTAVKG